jgi:hypothetical protein
MNFNLLETLMTWRRQLEVVRWTDDDHITHKTLRICITNLTQPNHIQSEVISKCTIFITRTYVVCESKIYNFFKLTINTPRIKI